jgi:hypothetical protein
MHALFAILIPSSIKRSQSRIALRERRRRRRETVTLCHRFHIEQKVSKFNNNIMRCRIIATTVTAIPKRSCFDKPAVSHRLCVASATRCLTVRISWRENAAVRWRKNGRPPKDKDPGSREACRRVRNLAETTKQKTHMLKQQVNTRGEKTTTAKGRVLNSIGGICFVEQSHSHQPSSSLLRFITG